jgi:hypothetical protein
MAEHRAVNVLCTLAWPVLVVSAMWAPADYALTGLVLVLAVIGAVWGGLHSAGQQVAVWWENVRGATVGRRFRR